MVVEKNDILIPGIQLYEPESLSRDIIPYSNLYKKNIQYWNLFSLLNDFLAFTITITVINVST